MRNYFRRDEKLKVFFARGTTWSQTLDNYGFQGEDRTEKADSLEGLLDTIAGFMPGPYLTARITKQTTSMGSVFDVIWEHYDVSPNPSTFLDFVDLCLMKEERYIDLYYRMLYHCEQHLVKSGAQVAGVQVQTDEILTHSYKNMITLNWLQALDPNLVNIVKLEKHKELKEGQQIYTFVNDISKNIDEWLKRHGQKPPTRSQDTLQIEAQVRNLRFEGYDRSATRGTGQYRGGNGRGQTGNGRDGNGRNYAGNGRGYGAGNGRGYNNRSNNSRFSSNRQFAGQNRFCPGCNYLAQELHLDVNFHHFPADCTRKQSVLRILRSEEQHLADEEQDDEHLGQDGDGEDYDEGPQHEDGGKTKEKICNSTEITNSSKPNIINAVWKSKSPTLNMYLHGHSVSTVIDEGSEISAINSALIDTLNMPISRTIEAAQTAGSLPLNIRGKTAEDILVYKKTDKSSILWNLGQCLIVDNLGCDILIGEPGKARNDISTVPMSKSIVTTDQLSNKIVLAYEELNSEQSFPLFSEEKSINNAPILKTTAVAKVNSVHTIYPRQCIHIPVPKEFKSESTILVQPTEKSIFPVPGIRQIKHGMICLGNSTSEVQILKDDILVFTTVSGIHTDTRECLQTRKIYDLSKKAMKQFEFPHENVQCEEGFLEKVQIDPDNILSAEYKECFRDILVSYRDIITQVPGRYNGCYGQVNCALNLSNEPPPSIKPRSPNYSEDKLSIIADIMDDMEKWGVLVKPETLGVIPTHVHPCILVPKEGGKFRLVTDFRSIQSFIKPLPTVMPTVSDAMTALSSADYHIELDFSNYWQTPFQSKIR